MIDEAAPNNVELASRDFVWRQQQKIWEVSF